jgi:hypothetical protein
MLDPDRDAAEHAGIFDKVGVIAAEMRARFGDSATDVARSQLEVATGDAAVRWNDILVRLSG